VLHTRRTYVHTCRQRARQCILFFIGLPLLLYACNDGKMYSYKAFASSTHVLLFRFCHELYCSVVDTGYREVYATAIESAGFLVKIILLRPLNPTMCNSQAPSAPHTKPAAAAQTAPMSSTPTRNRDRNSSRTRSKAHTSRLHLTSHTSPMRTTGD